MSVEQAFQAGLDLVRKAGLPAKGNDVAVLAAHAMFERHAAPKQFDPRFPVDGPVYAKRLIVRAYAAYMGVTP